MAGSVFLDNRSEFLTHLVCVGFAPLCYGCPNGLAECLTHVVCLDLYRRTPEDARCERITEFGGTDPEKASKDGQMDNKNEDRIKPGQKNVSRLLMRFSRIGTQKSRSSAQKSKKVLRSNISVQLKKYPKLIKISPTEPPPRLPPLKLKLINVSSDNNQYRDEYLRHTTSKNSHSHRRYLKSIKEKMIMNSAKSSHMMIEGKSIQAEAKSCNKSQRTSKLREHSTVPIRKAPKPIIDPAPLRQRTAPVNPAYTVRKSRVPNTVYTRPYRDRVIHLLALKDYSESELVIRLQKDGIKENDKNYIRNILYEVADFNHQNCSYSLKDCAFSEIQRDWPGYNEIERQTLEMVLSRKIGALSSPESSADSCSYTPSSPEDQCFNSVPEDPEDPEDPENQCFNSVPEDQCFDSVPEDQCFDSVSEDQCFDSGPEDQCFDSVPEDQCFNLVVTDDFMTNEFRVFPSRYPIQSPSHSHLSNDSESDAETAEDILPPPTPSYGPTSYSPVSVNSNDDFCNTQKDSETEDDYVNVTTEKSNKDIMSEIWPKKHSSSSVYEADNEYYDLTLKDKQPTDSASQEETKSPESCGNFQEEDSAPAITTLIRSISPDYICNYFPIHSSKQRRRYVREFRANYDEYHILYNNILNLSRQINDLKWQKKFATPGSKEYQRIAKKLKLEYQKLEETNPGWLKNYSRCSYLHNKMAHIHNLIIAYDQSHHPSKKKRKVRHE
ncbi:RNA polymerase II elongation factor ELL2-like [Octodon degus]|uniref:RNA polymerase II elongation factor ELL2-like n=1 Tax=Octodon degus TaxID=10160 RepID=A0A6P3FJ06_OCTDE|nr:RNA polymerase II elongation factor ELL2-like [Octodon degus]